MNPCHALACYFLPPVRPKLSLLCALQGHSPSQATTTPALHPAHSLNSWLILYSLFLSSPGPKPLVLKAFRPNQVLKS